MRKLLLIAITHGFVISSFTSSAIAQNNVKRKKGVVPAWRIQIVDESGKPIKGARVRQSWMDNAVEENYHDADAISDDNGYVSFPQRKVKKGNPISRTIGKVKNVAQTGPHASFGISVFIMAWTNELEGNVDYDPDKPLPTQLIMHPRFVPKRGV